MSPSPTDPIHHALLTHALTLSLNAPPKPGSFSVGAILFLPSTSPLHTLLQPSFQSFSTGASSGLILAESWSREIEGNTHGEANALTKFDGAHRVGGCSKEEVLRQSVMYTTMEPCSIRTSGLPSCSAAIITAGIPTVYMGTSEPADYVNCEGLLLLKSAGVAVHHVPGLEEECLQAARRGL